MAWKLIAASLVVGVIAFMWATAASTDDGPIPVDCAQGAFNRGADMDACFDKPWYEERPWLAGVGAGAATFVIGGILISVSGADRSRRGRP